MKSSGERGKPYLIPLEALKNLDGASLIKTTKFVEVRQPIIQLTPRRGTPIWINISLMYDQLTLSNALTRSNLRVRAQVFLILTE